MCKSILKIYIDTKMNIDKSQKYTKYMIKRLILLNRLLILKNFVEKKLNCAKINDEIQQNLGRMITTTMIKIP